MNVALFSHSLLSDWNHGNAHFLRGVVTELVARGCSVRCFEPRDAWSITNLVRDHGEAPLEEVRRAYPALDIRRYGPEALDLDEALAGVDLVLVHEWNEPALVAAIGERRKRGGTFRALFHDTHHRSVSAPDELTRYDLSGYDGVLVFGRAVARVYEARGWGRRAFVWHEAADVRVFRPLPEIAAEGDLVWIGNWGDGERSAELAEMLIEPCRALGLKARVHGVRYPDEAKRALANAGIEHAGWLPNYAVPDAFARHRVTVHVPRRFYRERLPGIPTIRPFEALACGIPLVSAPWLDEEGLFRPSDYLVAHTGAEMTESLRKLLHDPALRRELARRGRETILARHTCAHRVDELLSIASSIGVDTSTRAPFAHA
ncbi:MAG TPA: glycosyltransferase [Polyangiaceae bacterium]|nr:glycosyltransferase [Polyangiaceae bacterium]